MNDNNINVYDDRLDYIEFKLLIFKRYFNKYQKVYL